MALRSLGIFVACLASVAVVSAQDIKPESESVIELKALVFVLQTQLNATEKELAREKMRRVELEEAELRRARETLDPAVKKKLGLPVPEAARPAEKPAPQTPPK